MITITRVLEFDAGHRVMNHEAKCATLHGHRYRIEIQAHAPELDTLGRVIDFSILKELIGTWLDTHWDHTCVIYQEDKAVLEALDKLPRRKPVWVAPWNPTAENMAAHLLKVVCPELLTGTGVEVTKVTVWETPNCKAEATL